MTSVFVIWHWCSSCDGSPMCLCVTKGYLGILLKCLHGELPLQHFVMCFYTWPADRFTSLTTDFGAGPQKVFSRSQLAHLVKVIFKKIQANIVCLFVFSVLLDPEITHICLTFWIVLFDSYPILCYFPPFLSPTLKKINV